MAAKSKSTDEVKAETAPPAQVPVERVQLGVRIEKRMAKVLKGLAEFKDITLGELLEDMVLHGFEGEGACAFGPAGLRAIKKLKEAYGMDYDVHTNYRFAEKSG